MRAGVPTIKRPAKMMFMFFSLWVWNVELNRLKYSQRGQNSPTLKTTVPFRCEKNSKLIPPTSVSGTDLLSCKFLVLDVSLARLRLDRRFSRPVPGLRDDGHRARKEHRVTVGDCLVRFRVGKQKEAQGPPTLAVCSLCFSFRDKPDSPRRSFPVRRCFLQVSQANCA